MPSLPATPITIAGPAGALQAQLDPADNARALAVLCHPHPQYGGSMHDAVLDAVADALLPNGVTCLRFNFRGVGSSAGSFDGGRGEVDDVLAVLQWAHTQPGAEALWLAGYSFGSMVGWQAVQRAADFGLSLTRVLLVAPPMGRMTYAAIAGAPRTDVFAGDDDQFVDWPAVDAWHKQQGDTVTVHKLEGADHFFAGEWRALTARIAATLS